jgi:hypothetical protein
VAEAFEMSRRRDISYSHHEVIAHLTEAEPGHNVTPAMRSES